LTVYTRHNLPADITVFAGDFASQPLAFAHLLDAAPGLDLTHVEVIQDADPSKRLGQYFESATVATILNTAAARDTLILILPAAHDSSACPLGPTTLLTPLGSHRGTIARMIPS
jgi:hypothetical protein